MRNIDQELTLPRNPSFTRRRNLLRICLRSTLLTLVCAVSLTTQIVAAPKKTIALELPKVDALREIDGGLNKEQVPSWTVFPKHAGVLQQCENFFGNQSIFAAFGFHGLVKDQKEYAGKYLANDGSQQQKVVAEIGLYPTQKFANFALKYYMYHFLSCLSQLTRADLAQIMFLEDHQGPLHSGYRWILSDNNAQIGNQLTVVKIQNYFGVAYTSTKYVDTHQSTAVAVTRLAEKIVANTKLKIA